VFDPSWRKGKAVKGDPHDVLPLVDVHAHLYGDAFSEDLDDVLGRAEKAGVQGILAVSEGVSDVEEILALARRYPLIKPCAGLHPAVLDWEEAQEMVAFIRGHRESLVAIGEVGLDYWVAKEVSQRELQRRIFTCQISLARELELPVNVHSRSAGRHTIELLRENGLRDVLMHAFDGKASSAREGLEAGYYFSIPPSIVRSPQKQKLVRHLPLERLMLESDSPVLGPTTTERNEPSNVALACRWVAQIKGIPADEVARMTTENARRLFRRAFC
jgi:TatD DNase family protein